MLRKRNTILITLIAGIVLITIGMIVTKKDDASRYDKKQMRGEEQSEPVSIRSSLAESVMLDGRGLLRARRFRRAGDAAVVAGLLDERSGYQELLRREAEIRENISRVYMGMASDARAAGNDRGAQRSGSIAKRLHRIR